MARLCDAGNRNGAAFYFMRYGLIREASFLPPPHEQRAVLEALSCDVIVQERETTGEAVRRVDRLLFGVKPGDEVVVQSLMVFLKTTGELVQTLRNLLDLEASVIVAASLDEHFRIGPQEPVVAALNLLAEHESRRPNQTLAKPAGRIGGGSRKPLSPYQVKYARKLHADGESLRSIGLLFQISPQDVWELVSR